MSKNIIKTPKTIEEIIEQLETDIDKLSEEIKYKNQTIQKLLLYKLYLEQIINKEV